MRLAVRVRNMGTMIRLAVLLIGSVISSEAACEYQVTNFKYSTCDGKPSKAIVLQKATIQFNDECQLRIVGCLVTLQRMTSIVLNYKASKSGIQVVNDKKDICGYKLFDTTITCPYPKGKKICATDKWLIDFPKSLLPMAVGKLTGDVKASTSGGEICYKVSCDIIRSK